MILICETVVHERHAITFTVHTFTHVICFTDATGARSAINSGGSGAPQLDALATWIFENIGPVQLLALHQPGKRNRAADGLSREDGHLIRHEAKSRGFKLIDLKPPSEAIQKLRDISLLPHRH